MPLKIRCPHCRRILLAEDDTAGQRKLCPACQRPLDVPLPLRAELELTNVAVQCPRCGADVAPGTIICQRCFTDITTGMRLPLLQRLARIPIRTWTVCGLTVALAALFIYVGVHVVTVRLARPQTPETVLAPAPAPGFPAEQWAARLLGAPDEQERASAREALVLGCASAAEQVARAVAAALQASLGDLVSDERVTWNRRAALDVLGFAVDREGGAATGLAPLLAACAARPELHVAARRAQGLLGDAAALPDLRELWLERARRYVFLRQLARLTAAGDAAVTGTAVRAARAELDYVAAALHGLKETREEGVLDALLESYWDGRTWLGQQRSEALSEELFELAKPRATATAADAGFELEKQAIRGARDALQRAGQRAAPAARAAAGLVLAHCAPQYESARQRIVAAVVSVLAGCEPAVQQRLTWAVARLTGRQFGRISGHGRPADVQRTDVEAVLRWARSAGVAEPGTLRTSVEDYPTPRRLTYRVVPPLRQLERDLLEEFGQGWERSRAALERWLVAGLGCTAEVRALLDPGQRSPNYPALAAALVIAAGCEARDVSRELLLWQEARDQPGWVRALAFAALGALDAKAGRWTSGWPAGWQLPPVAELEAGRPGWEHFGYTLALGGVPMIDRLERVASLPGEAKERLHRIAGRMARLRAAERNP
jgi:phage host-nuclease inhibitor protein Gam